MSHNKPDFVAVPHEETVIRTAETLPDICKLVGTQLGHMTPNLGAYHNTKDNIGFRNGAIAIQVKCTLCDASGTVAKKNGTYSLWGKLFTKRCRQKTEIV